MLNFLSNKSLFWYNRDACYEREENDDVISNQRSEFPEKAQKMKLSTAKSAAAWAVEILIVLLVAFVLVYCAGMRVTMVGNSMESTVSDGSQILVNRFIYNVKTPKSGDVIVFLPNGNEKSHYYVKRVIGVPGDKVQIKSGRCMSMGNYMIRKIQIPSKMQVWQKKRSQLVRMNILSWVTTETAVKIAVMQI